MVGRYFKCSNEIKGCSTFKIDYATYNPFIQNMLNHVIRYFNPSNKTLDELRYK